jgi:hypothetical protein
VADTGWLVGAVIGGAIGFLAGGGIGAAVGVLGGVGFIYWLGD